MSEDVAIPQSSEADLGRNLQTILQMIVGGWVTQIVRATADLSIVDHLAAGSATAEVVAARAASHPRTTYRLMRAAASLGLLAYDGDRRFSVTPLGRLLGAGAPGSLREMALIQGAHGHWQCWERLPDGVRVGKTQADVALGMGLFDYFERINPAEGALFSAAMANATGMNIEDVVATVDCSRVGVAVDVGGASGALILALLRHNPALKGVLFDRPNVIESGLATAERASAGERFSAVGGDFFVAVPPADLYLLKMILHDWSDDDCRVILRNCRASANTGARAIIVESVIGKLGQPDFGALLDMNMLSVTGGEERDLAEFDALFAATGWRRIATHPTRSLQTILELQAI